MLVHKLDKKSRDLLYHRYTKCGPKSSSLLVLPMMGLAYEEDARANDTALDYLALGNGAEEGVGDVIKWGDYDEETWEEKKQRIACCQYVNWDLCPPFVSCLIHIHDNSKYISQMTSGFKRIS